MAELIKQADKSLDKHDKNESAQNDAREVLAAEAAQAHVQINGKDVDLKGGFNRNESNEPQKRYYFPQPDITKSLVEKGSPEASTGESPRSLGSKVENETRKWISQHIEEPIVEFGAGIAKNFTFNRDWKEYGEDRSALGKGLDLGTDAKERFQLYGNLQASYPMGERTGRVPENLVCPKNAEVSRSANGTCNDLNDPGMGAAGTRFQFNTMPDMRFDINDPPIMDVANILARDNGKMKELPVLNQLGAFNLQMNVHDWMDHGKHQNMDMSSFWHLSIPADHPIAKNHGQTEMLVPKLLVDSTRNQADGSIRTAYNNTVTHWWDASQIYGSDKETSDRLREHKNGMMRLDEHGLLPKGPQGVSDTGFNQNWNPQLEVVHTLYVREHNQIADMLAKAYPQDKYPAWKEKVPEILKPMFGEKLPEKLSDAQYDEFIYSRARLINAAEIAKIHTVDWTPVALNNKTMTEAMYGNYGLEKTAPLSKIFTQHELGGIWGHKTNMAGIPYAMEEDFVRAYQEMHGLVPDKFALFDHTTGKPLDIEIDGKQTNEIPMDKMLQGDAHKVVEAAGFDNVLYSMLKDPAGQITVHNHPDFMRDLNIRGNYIDLGAVDILRDREKHNPRYNEYLREMHQKPLDPKEGDPFKQLFPSDEKLREEVRKVYGNDIEKVDNIIGGLGEWPDRTPKTMGFSASIFQEFVLMASRRVQADRFYTEDFRPEIYTPEGIDRVVNLGGIKELIERNAPELKNALATRESAFHPTGNAPIPLNNSGIDEVPANDLQKHVAAFNPKLSGEVGIADLEKGFEAIGYSPWALNPSQNAWFKASMAELRFGSLGAALGLNKIQVGKLQPDPHGFYGRDGNLDSAKIDALYHGKSSISRADVNQYLDARKLGFFDRKFVEGQFDSGFHAVRKDTISREEFIKIMNGDMMKARIAEAEAKANQ